MFAYSLKCSPIFPFIIRNINSSKYDNFKLNKTDIDLENIYLKYL